MSAQIQLRRADEPPTDNDGYRVLIDRTWPREVSREAARLDEWLGEVGPSHSLQTWLDHRVECWPEFRRRYLGELLHDTSRTALDGLATIAGRCDVVTLVFGARDTEHNNAVVLRDALAGALTLELPGPRPDATTASEEIAEDELLDLERLSRGRLKEIPGDRPPADVALVAFLPAYIDARTAGLCAEGALEIFGEALRSAIRPPRP